MSSQRAESNPPDPDPIPFDRIRTDPCLYLRYFCKTLVAMAISTAARRAASSAARFLGRAHPNHHTASVSSALLRRRITDGLVFPKAAGSRLDLDFSPHRSCFSSLSQASDGIGKYGEEYDDHGREPLDPFSLVADELSTLADRLRSMVVAEVPKLASAAEYFFKHGVEGKRFRPTVLLLMASALDVPFPKPVVDGEFPTVPKEVRARQQSIAEITEMIHVASLLHDDVLDDAETRRGISSLNFAMGNKLAVLAGDFLLSKACVALASLKNTEVVALLATVVEHLVTGETMQMTTNSGNRCSMEYYLQKTYYKTASLISNSCKAIAILSGQTAEVSMLAYDYGRNLGLAFQLVDDVLDFTGTSASLGKGSLSDIRHGIVTAPILFAMEEFPQIRELVDRGFSNTEDVDTALDYLGKSQGIKKTRELAQEHATRAVKAIEALPYSSSENARISRRALVDLTRRVITRTK